MRLEELPLVRQLALVASSTALAGVHGQGLTFAAFLPASRVPWTGLLEVLPHMMLVYNSHGVYDYSRWSRVNGVRYFRLIARDDPACFCRNFRTCGNVTATPELLEALHELAARAEPTCAWKARRVGPGWSCATNGAQLANSHQMCSRPRGARLSPLCRNRTSAPPHAACEPKPGDLRCVCSVE